MGAMKWEKDTSYETQVERSDDLVLLSSTPQGLQQHLDLLDNYCQNWAQAVNLKKISIMVFQKKPRCQEHRYQFSLEHTMQYTYLGLIVTASGSFSLAVFQVAYIIIKAANSPRPGNWVLERSLDGVDFQPWQYYAISDTECLTRYNITPRLGPPTYKRDDEVICTSYYSRLVPLEHGEIHTSLINGRPSADDLTPELLEFTSARFIRLRLQRIRTLNADLMTLSYRDPKDVDPIVTRRYYYSIKDVSVGGMCICYGHAQSCPWDPVTKKLQCVCEHNTCGESCNECCPGYHQEPWQPGTLSDGNTCEKCNCHNKAEDCYYNQTVADLRLSVNTLGLFVGGGVCVTCSQNTAGVNCQTCADGYYRPHQVSPYSDNPCVKCQCDTRGSASPVCIRDDNHTNPDAGLSAGQCLCKEGFAGEKCDRCAFGFRDFPQCTRCECNLAGSHNVDPCSECVCKVNVMGSNCDLCKQGFYNLQDSNPEGCTECFCFGVSDVCESSTWFTSSVEHRDGVLLRPLQSSSIFTSPVSDDNLIVSNLSASAGVRSEWSWAAPESFLNNKLTSYGSFLNYSVAYDTSEDNVDRTLQAHFSVIIEGNGRMLREARSARLLLNAHTEQHVSLLMLPQTLRDARSGSRVQRDELMTVLADVAALRVRAQLEDSAEGTLRLSSVSLGVGDTSSGLSKVPLDVEQCECPWGYSGTSCEYCVPGFYRVGGILFGGNCLQCECNDHAAECDINGECLGCAHNTTGPHCDHCMLGFYGDASEGTPDDCQRCSCPLTLESNNFSPTCVLQRPGEFTCDQCQLGYAGAKCERCADGYYGDPAEPGRQCLACECNGNVDRAEAGHCDGRSGECLKCLGHTAGRHCERCTHGFYGDAVTLKNCQACGCHGDGSLSTVCHVITGQCECKAHVIGQTCGRCQAGYYGIRSGDGCRLCECNQSGALSASCDEEGRCQCITGVTGDKCERCERGYYSFTESGCTPCDCAHTHGDCNADTGECICPPHTLGLKCEECEEGHWGHDGVSGCTITLGSAPALLRVVSQSDLQGTLEGVSYSDQEMLLDTSHLHSLSVLTGPYYWRLPISNISLDTALEADEAPQGGDVARLVETCECPLGYAGLSCQECAPGFYRQAVSELNMKGRKRPLIRPCVPCRCNNHSLSCDLDTGECLGCQHSTAGEHCHVCAAGYYGKVQGSVRDCSLCTCPLRGQSFSSTCVLEGAGDFRCDRCEAGYEGRYCESVYVSRSAVSVLEKVQEEMSKPFSHNRFGQENISTTLTTHSQRLLQVQEALNTAESHNNHSRHLLDDIQTSLQTLTISRNNVSSLKQEVETQVQEAQDLLSDALNIAEDMRNGTATLDETRNDLEGWSPSLRKHVDALVMDLTRRDALQLVYRAEDHAQALRKQAQALNSSLSEVRSAAVNATSATQTNTNLREHTQLAEDLAHAANQSASSALNLTSESEHSLTEQGKTALQKSSENLDTSGSLKNHTEGLVFSVREVTSRLSLARASVQNVTQLLPEALHILRNLPNGSRAEVLEAKQQQEAVNASLQEALERLEDYRVKLQESSSAVGSANNSIRSTNQLLRDSEETASAARSRLSEAHLKTERLFDRLKPLQTLGENLSRNLSQIKELIRQARKQAASIKVSVSADKDCVRAYRPEVSSSNFNTLTLTMKTSEPDSLLFYMGSSSASVISSFHFDGSGFSVLEKSLRSMSTSVVMFFKTLSPNGLLLYLASNGTRDFLSIELVEGKVHLTFELGSGALTLTSNRTYNTGTWYRIALQRNKRRGHLSVMAADKPSEREVMEAESPGSASDLNRSDLDPIYIGGLPASRPIRRQVVARSFVGCMKNVEIARTNFDLLRESYGVKKGCVLKPIRSVSVFGGGFLQMPAVLLAPHTEIMSSFSSRRERGVILAGFSSSAGRSRRHTQQPFLVVMLVSGSLEVHVGGAEGGAMHRAVVKSQNGSFSDGQEHSLILQRNKRSIAVFVDEQNQATVKLGLSADKALALERLFIGGVPPGETGSSDSFYGCIRNTAVDGMLLDLSSALRYEDVDMDSCLLEERPKRVVLPDELEAEPTSDPATRPLSPSVELSALTPGSSSVSHTHTLAACLRDVMFSGVQMKLSAALSSHAAGSCFRRAQSGSFFSGSGYAAFMKEGYNVGSDVSVSLDFRSTAPDGVLLGISSTKVDAIGLELVSGQCVLIVNSALVSSQVVFNVNNGAGRITARSRSAVSMCDGRWRTLVAKKQKHSLSLTVDGVTVTAENPYSSSTSAETKNPIYVGGYPADVKQNCLSSTEPFRGCMRNLRVFKGHVTDELDFSAAFAHPHVTHSLAACLRDVMFSGVQMKLSAALSSHAAGSCFRRAQSGSFFSGSGYAAFMKEGYNVGSDVSVSLDFRSTAPDGVLLGISSTKVDAIGLELVSGQVVFNVNNGAGRITARSRSAVSMCDGRWRTLVAKKQKHSLSLTVDGVTVTVENPYSSSTSAETKNPIYVGGYPADVKQNCLSSTEPFRGCMRNLRVFKGHVTDELDFSAAFAHPHVFPHSCPDNAA
ncbi:laminin subunit alpha-1 [Sinocyclocheilus grahami]|uniref:laminin subunit alpha-1 n=1 Tax=Sinocyclocheilus grahami TaxID=75366 RepID=UPI0007ACFFAD|nr:PREDICTED: laminin subunit alpha-1-like [Sinocyclocheilus grahami]